MVYWIPIDPREVPPEPPTIYCPYCKTEDPAMIYTCDRDKIGCENCIRIVCPDEYDAGEEWDSYTCPFCLHEADYLYEQDGNIVGCSECIDYIDYLL